MLGALALKERRHLAAEVVHPQDEVVGQALRRLRERGWLVPAYPFPKDREDLHVLRVVARTGNIDRWSCSWTTSRGCSSSSSAGRARWPSPRPPSTIESSR
jgi:hypothetical protein